MYAVFALWFVSACAALGGLVYLRASKTTLLVSGMGFGILFGVVAHYLGHFYSNAYRDSLILVDFVAKGYIRLLFLLVVPLIFFSILNTYFSMKNRKGMGIRTLYVVLVLMLTNVLSTMVTIAIAALAFRSTQIFSSMMFKAEQVNADALLSYTKINIYDRLIQVIPDNIIAPFISQKPSGMLPLLCLVCIVCLSLNHCYSHNRTAYDSLSRIVSTMHSLFMGMTNVILSFAPFGVMALMISMIGHYTFGQITHLGALLVLMYLCLLSVFIMHLTLSACSGLNPLRYMSAVAPALSFAFFSRSSSATIPMTYEVQVQALKVDEDTASLTSTFGTFLGQNGCASVYPALLALISAPLVGQDPFDVFWLGKLVLIIAVCSVGVSGVGGGAFFATLFAFNLLNLPLTLVVVLMGIEPIIDMGRTAINVSGSVVTGLFVQKHLNRRAEPDS